MTALLFVLALFAGWSLIGLGMLALVGTDTADLRVALTAPAVGMCVTAAGVFPFSEAGLPVKSFAVPFAVALLLGSVVSLALRRPRVHVAVAAVGGLCVGGLLLSAWPLFSLGFHWLANGNDDMANYVLSAQQLLGHGLLTGVDFRGLANGTDYATALSGLHISGGRPGTDLVLAVASRIAGRPPYEMFMPVILALHLCGASAVGALALQFTRRVWVALLAVGLILVSPLATYGVVQQLIAQVWGLGVGAALLALLFRPDLYDDRRMRPSDAIPIGILVTGLILGYVELLPAIGLSYLVYLGILRARKQLSLRGGLRLWLPAGAVAVLILNTYLVTELKFLQHQANVGLTAAAGPPLFGFMLVPSGLPGVVGLQTLPPGAGAPYLDLSIVLAVIMIVGALVAGIVGASRGAAAQIVLVVEAALGILLVAKSEDFALFKLSMYVQPFLAAAAAVWISRATRWPTRAAAGLLLGVLVVAELSSQRAYVERSRAPVDVPHISAADVIPAFHADVVKRSGPIVSVAENPVLVKLEAASAEGRPVYFQSRNVFAALLSKYAELGAARSAQVTRALKSGPWVPRTFRLLTGDGSQDRFEEDLNASRALGTTNCGLVVPGPGELPFNRYALPAGSPNLVSMGCGSARHLLAFTSSSLGESFYLPAIRRNVSFFQLQQDPFFFSRTMAGFGRYALFQLLGSSAGDRLVIELTNTAIHDGANLLPPAAIVGSSRRKLPLEGRGSARVVSAPLTPQIIAGQPYIVLDMGVDGRLPSIGRTGLQGLYGGSVPIDPRYLTTYVRDVSLMSARQLAERRPPSVLESFPRDLNNPALEYSGLYEDGWMGADAYVTLAGGPSGELVIRGEVPAGAGKQLLVSVGRRKLAAVAAHPGPLDIRIPVAASTASRRVELHFGATTTLKAPDLRPAAARLTFLGLSASRKR